MSNKPRGLGRGLGDLLADNSPEVRGSSVIRKNESGEVTVSPVELSPVTAVRETGGRYAEEEISRPLVFPQVTPIVGGTSQADEAREILEADAAISGRPVTVISAGTDEADTAADRQSGAEKEGETVVHPRSLKAVFRNFK